MPANEAGPGWLGEWAYAHRGLHGGGIPENSLAAFRAAMDVGLGIECDLRKSRDGRAVIFHDADLARMTGKPGRVGHTGIGELTAMLLLNSLEPLATLRDLLALVAGRVPVLLELKIDAGRAASPLCRAVLRDCEGYDGPLAVMSYDPRVSVWFAKRRPQLARGLVMTERDARTFWGGIKRRLALRAADAQFLAYDVRYLPSSLARREVRRGKQLLSWTVLSAGQLETALAEGAAPIIEGAGVAAWESRT